jgi:hypothetical protein
MTHDNLHELGEQIAADVAHIDAALHRVLSMLRVFDAGGGWLKQRARSCSQWLSWRVSWSRTTAREHVRVANALGTLPKIDDALRLGKLARASPPHHRRPARADLPQVRGRSRTGGRRQRSPPE